MNEHPNIDKRTLVAAIGVAAALVVALVLVFALSGSQERQEQIVLPDASVQSPVPEQTPAPEDSFAEITTENVQNILARLHRPTAYHQTLEVAVVGGGRTRTSVVEIWQRGNVQLVQTLEGDVLRSCLTDGSILYLWYSDQSTVQQLTLDGTISADDLMGIPSYEVLTALKTEELLDASFLPSSEEAMPQTVYVRFDRDGLTQEYWVSVDTGLLFRQEMREGGVVVYRVRQLALEVLMDSDEALSDVFTLPDGSHPFS